MAAAGSPLPLEALARAFGKDAAIGGAIQVVREVHHAGQTVVFAARQDGPRTFLARLTGPSGVLAEARLDLDSFAGVEAFVRERLGTGATPPKQQTALAPAPGQVWVMDVRVEREDSAGLHYSMLNAEGTAAGSSRVLRRPEFEATFAIVGGRPRLLARVIDVSGGQVGYVQLDPRRQAVGGARRSSLATFTGNFRSES
jgi:hypothetical protein